VSVKDKDGEKHSHIMKLNTVVKILTVKNYQPDYHQDNKNYS